VYTFHLRHGATFHDGRPITARDVRASILRALDPSSKAGRQWPLFPIRGARAFAAGTARTLDRRTADAVVERDPRAIRIEDACGVFALRGIVEHARRHDLAIRLLDLRSSADTAGDPWRVVGYGAFAVGAP
jgi:IS4 transposase